MNSTGQTTAPTSFDHLVIAANTLEQGVKYVRDKLGVTLPFGGIHPAMGTHNHLARLGKNCFLEIIAKNPESREPLQPQWFSLGEDEIAKELRNSPRLLTWVVNTDTIEELTRNASYECGIPTPVQRGNLNWHFALPHKGRLMEKGLLPYIIQWQGEHHPAENMKDLGIRLKALNIFHPEPAHVQRDLQSIHAAHLVTIYNSKKADQSSLQAIITSPKGEVVLDSCEGSFQIQENYSLTTGSYLQ